MEIETIEKEIIQNYENDRFSPLGADGGVMRYILCNTKEGTARASITLDSEIGEIRKVWALSLDRDGNGFKEVYDFSSVYYKLRK